MCNKFVIEKNNYLSRPVTAYYHQPYTGYRKPGNPDFLNVLKNKYGDESYDSLIKARDKVVEILTHDLKSIIDIESLTNCIVTCVPRAKALIHYCDSQLMFKSAVSIAAGRIHGVFDATDCIIRTTDTQTTHIRKPEYQNAGDRPYPGITANTCHIEKDVFRDKSVILVDDIYTKTVNVDEDCIQALFDSGAHKIVFYAVGYTSRRQ